MKLETNLFDITKSLFLVVLIIILFLYIPRFLDNFNTNKSKLDETVIENITSNVIKATLAENNAEVKRLRLLLEERESKALQDIKNLHSKIEEIGLTVAKLKSNTTINPKSDYHEDKETNRDLDSTVVYGKDSEGDKFPLATVWYSPEQPIGDRWATQTHPLNLHVDVVEAVNKEGNQDRYVEAWIENNWSSESKGKRYPVDVSMEWAKTEPNEESFMFNPRMGFSAFLDTSDISPGLDLSLFSYGKTKRDMDWRFVGFSVSGNKENISLGFIPVYYNIGNFLPIVENLFLDGDININSEGELNYGIGLSIPF